MTFHIFFFTITLQKKHLSEADLLYKQQLQHITDEVKDRRSSYYNQMY
ncbi:YrzI family small protein [Bacillus gaemokensis]|uniref:Polyketide synthase n=1 Tax=Bacillus gaemokensis TaxID=574375 RepID=A0A073K926_9BACI|nr:YrzI family small protein [Bacillus gaemokensis]KEK22922.1 polyketide synthase [Bacillus gaemokensis]KYG34722.1 polyketide synthase [Bacillus gaemokensis]